MAKSLDRTDTIALGASVAAHLALFGLLSIQLAKPDAPPLPKPMAVEIIAESDLEATSPNPSDEAPAARKAMEEGPIEDAPAPATTLPEPAPVMPEPIVTPPKPQPVARVQPKPTPRPTPATKPKPKPAPKVVTPPKQKTAPPARKVVTKPATKSPVKAATKPGAGSGKGKAIRPSGDLAGLVNAVGKEKGKSADAPGKSAAQIRQSITTSIGAQVRGPWSGCRVTGIDVDALTSTVRFRLNRNGSLDTITSASTSGQNDTNKAQVARHQECAKKAIQVAAPFTGLPPEHYSYWQNYEFKFQKR